MPCWRRWRAQLEALRRGRPLSTCVVFFLLLSLAVASLSYLQYSPWHPLPAPPYDPDSLRPPGPLPLSVQNDLSLDPQQCEAAFPGLFEEIERAERHFRQAGGVKEEDLSESYEVDGGKARLSLDRGRLFVRWFRPGYRYRMFYLIASLNEAVQSSPVALPNIDVVVQANDDGYIGAGWPVNIDMQHRGEVFLAPDFGFYEWDQAGEGGPAIGSWRAIRAQSKEYDNRTSWTSKDPRLFWRGHLNNDVRGALVHQSEGHQWSDVMPLHWSADNESVLAISMPEHCRYKYLVHTEGMTYSGRLKYLLNCRSVILVHEPLRFQQHFHPLLNGNVSSPDQNAVFVRNDFSDLPEVMDALIKDDARAERIADASATFFRERYLSPAAIACYWRRAIIAYAGVQSFQPRRGLITLRYRLFLCVTSHWPTFLLVGVPLFCIAVGILIFEVLANDSGCKRWMLIRKAGYAPVAEDTELDGMAESRQDFGRHRIPV